MKPLRFRHSPFDIAPGAQRYTRTAWRVFGAGLLFLLACIWLLLHARQELRNAQAAQTDVQAERQALVTAQRLEQTRLNDPVVMAKTKAQQSLQQMIRMSWFGLFDALETAARDVRGGVSLLSLVPSQAHTEATQVRLTAVAASAPVMLEYLRILRKDPRILSAELNSQQPDENVGPGVIRMQLTVLWNPQALAPAQPLPGVRTTEPGLVADAAIRRDPVTRVVVDKGAP
jgi:hypothetical protein